MICNYGCGKEAVYQFKNDKWCCSITYKSCPEVRKKNGFSQKGKKKFKKIPRLKPNFCDYGCNQEAKFKLKNNKWCCNKNWASCPEIRRKNSESNKGRISPTFGKKNPPLSERNIKGKWSKGIPKSEDSKRKNSESHKGEKHPNWIDGRSYEHYPPEFNNQFKLQIRERDHYTCQLCFKYGNNVHHIDYKRKHCVSDNAITLCKSHNSKVNKNREWWEIYFKLYLLLKNKGD
jgi:hypothetical protein